MTAAGAAAAKATPKGAVSPVMCPMAVSVPPRNAITPGRRRSSFCRVFHRRRGSESPRSSVVCSVIVSTSFGVIGSSAIILPLPPCRILPQSGVACGENEGICGEGRLLEAGCAPESCCRPRGRAAGRPPQAGARAEPVSAVQSAAGPAARNRQAQKENAAWAFPAGGKDSVKENRQGCLPRSIRAGAAPLRNSMRSPGASKKDAPAHIPTFPYARRGMCEGRTICGSSLRVQSGQRLPLYGIVCVPPAPAKKTPFGVFFAGAPKGIRTPGLPLRRGTLYPAELLARIG